MNNNLPQGVITEGNISNEIPQENDKKKMVFKKLKINKKTAVLLIAIIFAAFIIYCFFASGKGNKLFGVNKANGEDKIIEVDVDSEWGKEYAREAQELFKEREIDKFDIAFINLDDLNEPEMIIKYIDETEKEYMRVLFFDARNGKIKSSKDFSNASIKLIYSFVDSNSDFYLNIATSKKYGTYTLFSKIIAGTVVGADISATNDRQLNEFIDDYVIVDYDIVYYQVKKDNYADNFKTMYDRHEKYAKEIVDLKHQLKEQYRDNAKKKVDDKPYLVTGNYHLTYGEFGHVPNLDIDGNPIPSSYDNTTIILNNDQTISIKGEIHKFTVMGNVLTIDDGKTIKVNENDKFVLSDEGGTIFESRNPYVDEKEPTEGNKVQDNNGDSNPSQEEEKRE